MEQPLESHTVPSARFRVFRGKVVCRFIARYAL